MVLGALANLGLLYLCYLAYKSDLSVILKSGSILLLVGAFVGMVLTSARTVSLPRFGLLALFVVLLKFIAPVMASLLHQIPAIEKLLGSTTYAPHDLRWAVFSIALVFVMLLRSQGLLGHHEFSWRFVGSMFHGRRAEVVPA